jgi:hypothetical protein
MTHSKLTRWVEDADAREVLLEGAMIHQFQENTRQYIHLGSTIKTIASWCHHSVAEHLLSHKPASTGHH